MALAPDQKFSTFADGGDVAVNDIIVGLRGGINTKFLYTGELPPGVVVPISQGGTGATTAVGARLNLGLGSMALQDANAVSITGGALSGVTITASSLVSCALGTPISGVLTNCTGLPVPGGLSATGTPSASTFLRGDGTWATPAGTGVTSVSGTANRITSTGGTTPVIDISASYVGQASITTVGTIATGVWNGTGITVPFGGTGNSTFTPYSLICAGTTATGAFQNVSGLGTSSQVLVSNGPGALPSWQTVPGLAPAAMTKTDDTNVTLTLGGSPATSLLQAVSLTLGWTGTLGVTRGGTGLGSIAQGALLYGSATNVLSTLATANNGVLITSNTGVPSWLPNSATAGYVLKANSGAPASWQPITSSYTSPTVQKFLSGSGTYTTPTSPAPLYIRVVAVGGGGGGNGSGSGSGAGGSGGNTTFGTALIAANGATAGATPATASLGAAIGIATTGSLGAQGISLVNATGGQGASSPLGGGGQGGIAGPTAGGAANANTGSGGGGGGGSAGTGSAAAGNAGAYVDGIIRTPAASYAYSVGASGTGGTAGSSGAAGGAGAAGQIVVYEYYQ